MCCLFALPLKASPSIVQKQRFVLCKASALVLFEWRYICNAENAVQPLVKPLPLFSCRKKGKNTTWLHLLVLINLLRFLTSATDLININYHLL